jgi:predicted dinucleotide-binding enzyme
MRAKGAFVVTDLAIAKQQTESQINESICSCAIDHGSLSAGCGLNAMPALSKET